MHALVVAPSVGSTVVAAPDEEDETSPEPGPEPELELSSDPVSTELSEVSDPPADVGVPNVFAPLLPNGLSLSEPPHASKRHGASHRRRTTSQR